jgi:hypothetical protein
VHRGGVAVHYGAKICSVVKISLKASFRSREMCTGMGGSLIRLHVSGFLGQEFFIAPRLGLGDGHLRNIIRVQGR